MTALIVDGSNITMRAIKASESRGVGLSAQVFGSQVETAGLLLAINLLAKYVKQVSPKYLVVCFDSGGSDYRTKVDPGYKVKRATKDDAVMDTFDLFREFLTVSEIHHVAIPGVEADDLVAGYVYKATMLSKPSVILSGDKDFLQLLRANGSGQSITQIRPGLNPEVWTAQTVLDKLGATPQHLARVMALTGDKTDNVPGVPRVGEKTAIKILQEYDWNLGASLDHRLLAAHKERVLTNHELVNLFYGPWADIQDALHLADFKPSYGDDVLMWLSKFDMANVAGRVRAGTLWTTPTLFPRDLISGQ